MARTYTIVWTPTGGDAVMLCDLAAGWWPAFDQWTVQAMEQLDHLAFGGSVFRVMRGNVSGEVGFTVAHSHASFDDGAAWFQAQTRLLAASALVGGGRLVVTIGGTVWGYTGATWHQVAPVRMNGCEWVLRYGFGVTQMDSATATTD